MYPIPLLLIYYPQAGQAASAHSLLPRTCPEHTQIQPLCEAGDYGDVRLRLSSDRFPSSRRVRQASDAAPSAIGATIDAQAEDGVKWMLVSFGSGRTVEAPQR